MRLNRKWIAVLLVGAAVVAGAMGVPSDARARLLLRNEGVGVVRGDVRIDRSRWVVFVPEHGVRDMVLPPGRATIEIVDPIPLVRQVTLVSGQTTTLDFPVNR